MTLLHFLTYLLQRTREFCKSTELNNITVELLRDKLNAYAEYLNEAGFAQNVIGRWLWPRASITFSCQDGLFNRQTHIITDLHHNDKPKKVLY